MLPLKKCKLGERKSASSTSRESCLFVEDTKSELQITEVMGQPCKGAECATDRKKMTKKKTEKVTEIRLQSTKSQKFLDKIGKEKQLVN